jgi:hypothetical protein
VKAIVRSAAKRRPRVRGSDGSGISDFVAAGTPSRDVLRAPSAAWPNVGTGVWGPGVAQEHGLIESSISADQLWSEAGPAWAATVGRALDPESYDLARVQDEAGHTAYVFRELGHGGAIASAEVIAPNGTILKHIVNRATPDLTPLRGFLETPVGDSVETAWGPEAAQAANLQVSQLSDSEINALGFHVMTEQYIYHRFVEPNTGASLYRIEERRGRGGVVRIHDAAGTFLGNQYFAPADGSFLPGASRAVSLLAQSSSAFTHGRTGGGS